jgi:nitrite reductase/ring-hydroxylating ferredoxin subunit
VSCRDKEERDCPEGILIGRRRVLQGSVFAVGAVALAQTGCGGGDSEPSGPIAAGIVSAVQNPSLLRVPGANAVLGRDAGGLYAMTSVCTHNGCGVSVVGTALACPCHGSRFDANGAVTHAPATRPLQHLQVDLATDGTITIQASIPVAADVRTPVA